MQDLHRRASAESGWWVRLTDGSVRRVWAHRAAGVYICLREISSPAQEAARRRLAARPGTASAAEAARDAQLAAQIRCDVMRTPDLYEAFAFLGGDSPAMSALLEADPDLSPADFSGGG
jgi:hypothetical protein